MVSWERGRDHCWRMAVAGADGRSGEAARRRCKQTSENSRPPRYHHDLSPETTRAIYDPMSRPRKRAGKTIRTAPDERPSFDHLPEGASEVGFPLAL